MIRHDTIYKRDSKGLLRVWSIEQDGSRYRVHSGLADGKLAATGWTACEGKQGRNDEQQADFEIEAAYKHKLTREYHTTIEATDGGAHFFKPMLAQTYGAFPGSCYTQPKLDGIRCIATKDGLFSRQGKPISAVPHIHAALALIFEADPSLVLDGELYNHDLRGDFGEISSIVRKAKPTVADLEKAEAVMQYHVYDMPSHPGSFRDRSRSVEVFLQGNLGLNCGWIVPVETHRVCDMVELETHYERWLEAGYEGQMVRLDEPYEQKRSKNLLKRKEFLDAEFEVLEIEEGNGNWAGVAKAVRCRLPDGRVFGAGIRGTRDRAAALLGETHKVVTVRYFALTPDGVPRFPVVTKFHGAERTL